MGLSFHLCVHFFLSSSIPCLGCLVGLVRGIFGFWVIGDSSAGESGITGTGVPPLVCGESPASAVLVTPSLGLQGKSVIWSACW